MKKLGILCSLVIMACYVQAQERVNHVGFGLNAGLSVSDINGKDFSSKTGFTGGVSATFPVASHWFIQPEINYQQEGAKYTHSYYVGDMGFKTATLNMHYLNVPVLVKYRFPKTHLGIYAGPQVGFKLSAKDYVDNGTFNIKNENIKSTDWGTVYGLEYFFPVTPNSAVVLNARYRWGFTNIAKAETQNMPGVYRDSNKDEATVESYRNIGWSFTVGYRF